MKSWIDNRQQYEAFAYTQHTAAVLVTKDAWPWKVVAAFAALFVGYRSFLTEWATTFGPIMGYPKRWLQLSYRLLVHECEHSAQCEMLGWLVPVIGWFFGRKVRTWAGFPIFALLWATGGLPIGFCPGRFFLERGADRVSWRWMLQNGSTPDQIRARGMDFAAKVCGRQYGWSMIVGGKWLFRRAIEAEIRRAATGGA